jgi:hypothetical protein
MKHRAGLAEAAKPVFALVSACIDSAERQILRREWHAAVIDRHTARYRVLEGEDARRDIYQRGTAARHCPKSASSAA